jgi:hypothetical protein
MDEHPDRDASIKLAQHLAIATQIAEAVLRMRQQHNDNAAKSTQQQAAASRAERTAQHAADRLRWTPALKKNWVDNADLPDLGQAWGAAAGWADTDPTAERAASNVESRLAEMAPESMARYADLRQGGASRTDAMRDVAAHINAEMSQRPVQAGHFQQSSTTRTAIEGPVLADTDPVEVVPDQPGPSRAPEVGVPLAADEQLRNDTAGGQAREGAQSSGGEQTVADQLRAAAHTAQQRPDLVATPAFDEHEQGVALAADDRAKAGVWQSAADTATDQVTRDAGGHRLDAQGRPHPVDVAHDSHPRPVTGLKAATVHIGSDPAVKAKTQHRNRTR